MATSFPALSNFQSPFHQPFNQETLSHDLKSLLSLHRRLIEIESISGREHDVAKYLQSYLLAHNFTVELQEVEPPTSTLTGVENSSSHKQPPRFNLLAHAGKRDAPVLLSSHIDTVPPYLPYEIREQDQIWGRGSVDAKACVAGQIIAVEELLASGDIGKDDVALLFVVSEETGGQGMYKANELGLEWHAVIFGEPTELKLASGHKGNLGFTIKALGKAGHSGYPWLGQNANSMLIPALLALEKLELPSSDKYGNSTLNIGVMEGGVGSNVIAPTAMAQILIRVAAKSAEYSKKLVLDAMRRVDEKLQVEFVPDAYGPVDIDSDVEGSFEHSLFLLAST